MKLPEIWREAIQQSADPARVEHHLGLVGEPYLAELLAETDRDRARILCALFAGSSALSLWLIANPTELSELRVNALSHSRRKQGLAQEIDGWLPQLLLNGDFAVALDKLRFLKQRELVRIAIRDLAHLAASSQIVQEVSDVADVALEAVLSICQEQLKRRLGSPWNQTPAGLWQPTQFCVMGMGKLGGQELNYSSDIDVIFIYSEEGQVFQGDPRQQKNLRSTLSNHQFFNRLAELFMAEVSRLTGMGALYRIDLRLRPEGDSGPLTRSVGSYENYYSQWGQTWERMMLIKARCVAGDRGVAAEFLEMIQPFRFPRYLAASVLDEVAAMKARIETEVLKAGDVELNVKLGRGGIREIEFVAQTSQLLHAGKQPFLQNRQTIPTLHKLAQYDLLPQKEVEALSDAYWFLRDVEHRLQMEDNAQTHTIPLGAAARNRLARLMGFATKAKFFAALAAHSRKVRRIYDRLIRPNDSAPTLPGEFEKSAEEWQTFLTQHGFRDPVHSLRLLNEFVHGPGFVHVSRRTEQLARALLPYFFALCPNAGQTKLRNPDKILSDPDRVLNRLDSFVTAYGTRTLLLETWHNQPALFELLLCLFDRSEFLAEIAIREPDLVDDLLSSGRIRRSKSLAETLADLHHGKSDADQSLWLRRYHQAELMRIALRDITGLSVREQNLSELSTLAEACLQYALEIALRKLKFTGQPLAIIACGKLAGQELGYGSDLDLLFVTEQPVKSLPRLQGIANLVMQLLSERTAHGIAFVTDARLRPDGEKGLLVNTVSACEDYYRKRAQLWELQSLSRARCVAGNEATGLAFQELVADLTDFREAGKAPSKRPIAFTADWVSQIKAMRQRIELERTPAGLDSLAIKTGTGGLMDAEFLAQIFCLANGWHEPNTLKALQRAQAAGVWSQADSTKFIASYEALRRVEVVLRRWSIEGETVLPEDVEAFKRVAVRCGFKSSVDFQAALQKWRRTIRAIYNKQPC